MSEFLGMLWYLLSVFTWGIGMDEYSLVSKLDKLYLWPSSVHSIPPADLKEDKIQNSRWKLAFDEKDFAAFTAAYNTDLYHKFPKYSDTKNIYCNHSQIWTMWLYYRVMSPNDADGMANSVDPDQTAPLGAVWSGSALFAQAYLSENLRSLR